MAARSMATVSPLDAITAALDPRIARIIAAQKNPQAKPPMGFPDRVDLVPDPLPIRIDNPSTPLDPTEINAYPDRFYDRGQYYRPQTGPSDVNRTYENLWKQEDASFPKTVDASGALPQSPMLSGSGGDDALRGSGDRSFGMTAEDSVALADVSRNLGVKSSDLLTAMMYETQGTLNPDIVGGKGGRYQGLIQFGKDERKAYGYKTGMTMAEQLRGPVTAYLTDRGLQPGMDLAHIYSIINTGGLNKDGSPRLSWSDGNGTVGQHVKRMVQTYGDEVARLTGEPGAGLSAGNMATRPPGKDPQVAIQQMMLKAAGYDPGPIDGIAGKQTQAALTAYNTAKMMNPTAFAETDPMAQFQGMAAPASMATTPHDARAAMSPADDIRAPSISETVARGPLDADQVVRATIDADPAHLTSAWNHLVAKAMSAPDDVRKAATAFTEGLPVAVKQAAAASFGFNPDLIKSVPAIGWPGKPTVRDTVAASARNVLTFGNANEQLKSLDIGPGAGELSTPTFDDTPVIAAPAEQPPRTYQGGPAAGAAVPTRDPLQAINSRDAVNMATSQPEGTRSEGSPFQPALPVSPTDYAMGTIDLGSPAPVAASEPPSVPPVAAPPRAQAPAPSMATSKPGGSGLGGRIYRAVSQPITSGMANFWTGPMVAPNFTAGSGGSTMPYQRDTGMYTTNEHGQRVSLGVYTDSQGNQHTFESGL